MPARELCKKVGTAQSRELGSTLHRNGPLLVPMNRGRYAHFVRNLMRGLAERREKTVGKRDFDAGHRTESLRLPKTRRSAPPPPPPAARDHLTLILRRYNLELPP